MNELRGDLEELHRLLGEGAVQRAYAAIIDYLSGLRTSLASEHEEWSVGGVYQGRFDMTYFPLVTPSLKARGLKLAVVFDYPAFRFQVWLAARNRTVQMRYWQLLSNGGWPSTSLVEPAVGVDAIVVLDVADGVDLEDSDALTASLTSATKALLTDLERFFDDHDPVTV